MSLRSDPLGFIKNKFLKDTATLQVSSLLNQCSQIVSSIVLAFLLGAHGQGLFVLAMSLQGFLYNLLNVGVVQASVSQVAAAAIRGSHGKVKAWLAFLAKAFITLNALVITVGWFTLPLVAESWYGNRELGVWAWWLCFFPLIDTLRAVVFVALQGTRRMLLVAQLDNSAEVMRAFLVILGAVLTGSAMGAVIGEIVARVLWIFPAASLYRRARHDGGGPLPSLLEIAREIPRVPLRRGLRLGLRVGILKNLNSQVLRIVPSLVIGGLAGAKWVAYFNVAKRFMEMPQMLMAGVTRVALPALSELAGLKDATKFKRLYTRASLLGGGLVSAGILCFLPLIPFVVGEIYPADYPQPVFVYSLILALGYLPGGFAVALESFYIVTNQLRTSMILTIVGALVTIPLNVILMISLPETGAAWGHTVYMSWVLVHFAYIGWYFSRDAHHGAWGTGSPEPPAPEAASPPAPPAPPVPVPDVDPPEAR